jgi:hypothetical protein
MKFLELGFIVIEDEQRTRVLLLLDHPPKITLRSRIRERAPNLFDWHRRNGTAARMRNYLHFL